MDDLKPLIGRVADGGTLGEDEAETAFDIIMSGNATPAQIGAFLMALRLRGETVGEITGAARAMRAKAHIIEAPEGAMDIVGTGGDGTGTLNISTASAIVVAGCRTRSRPPGITRSPSIAQRFRIASKSPPTRLTT